MKQAGGILPRLLHYTSGIERQVLAAFFNSTYSLRVPYLPTSVKGASSRNRPNINDIMMSTVSDTIL